MSQSLRPGCWMNTVMLIMDIITPDIEEPNSKIFLGYVILPGVADEDIHTIRVYASITPPVPVVDQVVRIYGAATHDGMQTTPIEIFAHPALQPFPWADNIQCTTTAFLDQQAVITLFDTRASDCFIDSQTASLFLSSLQRLPCPKPHRMLEAHTGPIIHYLDCELRFPTIAAPFFVRIYVTRLMESDPVLGRKWSIRQKAKLDFHCPARRPRTLHLHRRNTWTNGLSRVCLRVSDISHTCIPMPLASRSQTRSRSVMLVSCLSINLVVYIVKSSTACTVIYLREQCSKNYSKHFVIMNSSDPAKRLVVSGTVLLEPAPVELGSGVPELGFGVPPLDSVGDALRL